jgi:hypothetical protein
MASGLYSPNFPQYAIILAGYRMAMNARMHSQAPPKTVPSSDTLVESGDNE